MVGTRFNDIGAYHGGPVITDIAGRDADFDENGDVPVLGFNFGDVLGGVLGGIGGAATGGLTTLLTGGIGSLLGGFLGDISQPFWSVSCIGGQAYNKQDLEAHVSECNAWLNNINVAGLSGYEDAMQNCDAYRVVSIRDLGRLASSCSKAYKQMAVDYFTATLNKLKENAVYTETPLNNIDYEGIPYTSMKYKVTSLKGEFSNVLGFGGVPSGGNTGGGLGLGLGSTGNTGIGGGLGLGSGGTQSPPNYANPLEMLLAQFYQLSLADQVKIQEYASSHNLSLNDTLAGLYDGTITIGVGNGGVTWSGGGSFGNNPPKDRTLEYLLYGGLALVAYKAVKK